jgi:integrase
VGIELYKLTARKVATISEKGYYSDGGGLYLQVTETGAKSWLFRYRFGAKRPEMGLGPTHTVSLAEARELAATARRQVLAGIDPLAGRREAKAKAALIPTFWDATQSHIEANRPGWKNAKHAAQWLNTLETYAKPIIGAKRVDRIETDDVLAVLNPIWHTKAETASRVRQRMETVIDSAIVKAKLRMENPARWKGHLEVLLPKPSKVKSVENFPALPYSELRQFMDALRARRGEAARALEFTILTAARTGMTVGAKPSEVSADLADWEIPADRMKGGIRHVVPLSAAAVALIQPRMGRLLLFPTEGTIDKELSENGMLAVLQRMEYGHVTVHGFRSTFKQWADEVGEYPDDLSEAALAHKVKDKAKAAYKRGTMLERRRKMMEAWTRFCGY